MRTQIRGQSYKHPFAQQHLAKPLNDEEKIHALKTKNWHLLIESHMRLGCSIAGRYVRLGGKSDEMVSAAMLGITVAVDRFKRGYVLHNNVTGYIINYIHQHCADALRMDCVIPVPQHNDTKIITCPITDKRMLATGPRVPEVYEALEHITHTEVEKDIVFLRQQGYIDVEVASILNISRSTVTKTRKRLLERYNNV
ncbi:MAG: sigma-70 family RNA polymerase sigma factor [Nitrosomonadaceae bacterium]